MHVTDFAMIDEKTLRLIEELGQQHLLHFWNDLSPSDQASFAEQLSAIDWKIIVDHPKCFSSGDVKRSVASASAPAHVVRVPKSDFDRSKWRQARSIGESALTAGKVAAVLLAGGQGTRLGFDLPKGMFPIGPVSGNSLFQILAEQIVAVTERYQAPIPYLIMTSKETHDETLAFFEAHQFFGLNRDELFFFQQGYSPCIDVQTGQLLLADRCSLQLNPDGHGGLLAAIQKAGLFEELKHRGVEYLFTHQIDNPLVRACDPAFIGLHIQHKSQVSTKVVAKSSPDEKVGVAADLDGKTAIIEYSDLPAEFARERTADGELKFWAGSTAIHVFDLEFLEHVTNTTTSLPWHRAVKKIPFLDQQGQFISPARENGVKFERFLFDTLPLADTALIVETIRAEEFAPLKNQSGDFSPEYVRRQMVQLAIQWLTEAGIKVPPEAIVEISPRFAMSPADLKSRSLELADLTFDAPNYLSPDESSAVRTASR